MNKSWRSIFDKDTCRIWLDSFICLSIDGCAYHHRLGHKNYFRIWLGFISVSYRIWLSVLGFKVISSIIDSSWNVSTMEVSSNMSVDCWSWEFGWCIIISYTFSSICISLWKIPLSCTVSINRYAFLCTCSSSTSKISSYEDTTTKLMPIDGIEGTRSVLFLIFFGRWKKTIGSSSSSFMYFNAS